MSTTTDCMHTGFDPRNLATAQFCRKCGRFVKRHKFSDFVADKPIANGATHQIEDGHIY